MEGLEILISFAGDVAEGRCVKRLHVKFSSHIL